MGAKVQEGGGSRAGPDRVPQAAAGADGASRVSPGGGDAAQASGQDAHRAKQEAHAGPGLGSGPGPRVDPVS